MTTSSSSRLETVAILSGAGFIGRALADRLARECDVLIVDHRAISDRDATERSEHVGTISQIDLTDKGAFRAAFGRLRAWIDLTVEDSGLELFFDTAASTGLSPKFVYASSSAVYGDQPENAPVKETADCLTEHAYGLSKLSAEKRIIELAETHSVPFAIARIFNVYGEGQDPTKRMASVIAKFAAAIASGNTLTTVNGGEQVRDFLHVNDIAEALSVFALNDDVQGIFNVGAGAGVSMKQLIEAFEDISSRSAKVEDKQGHGGIFFSVADTTKLFAETPFRPSVTLDEGLRRVWAKARSS